MPKRDFSWTSPKLEIRLAPKYGGGQRGFFAKKRIEENELLFVQGGYVLTLREESRLPKKLRDVGMQISDKHVMTILSEADDDGGFNHSCEPNVGLHGQIFFVAMRDIRKGEELVFDYAMVLFDGEMPYRMTCECGSEHCRGLITGSDWRLPELQKRYAGYFSWFLQEKIDRLGCHE